MKYLIVKGVAGLGNRLSTLAHAIGYAQKTGRTLLVDWSDGVYGIAGKNVFYPYFKLNDVPYIKKIDDISNEDLADSYPPLWGENPEANLYDLYFRAGGCFSKKIIPNRLIKGAFSKIHNFWHPKEDCICKKSDLRAFVAVFDKKDIPFGGKYRKNIKQSVVFFADFLPKFSYEILHKNISLSDKMQDEVNHITEQIGIGENTVGVHVRMTDLQPKSSLEHLMKKINNIKPPHSNIFLATDNERVEVFFRQRYPNTVFLPKHRLETTGEQTGEQTGVHHRSIRTGDFSQAETILKESILDMWLLSKCEYLIRQENSSFSKISAIMKNQPEKTFIW